MRYYAKQKSYNNTADKVSKEICDVPKRMDVPQTSFIYGLWIKYFSKRKELCSKTRVLNHSETLLIRSIASLMRLLTNCLSIPQFLHTLTKNEKCS